MLPRVDAHLLSLHGKVGRSHPRLWLGGLSHAHLLLAAPVGGRAECVRTCLVLVCMLYLFPLLLNPTAGQTRLTLVSFQDPLCNKDAWCGRRCPPAECLRGVLVRACAGACADQTRAYLAQGWFAACCLERGLLYYSMPADCRRVPLCGASPAQAFYTVVPLGRGLCVTMGAA